MNYDTWLMNDADYERYHGWYDHDEESAEDCERADERVIENRIDEYLAGLSAINEEEDV